MGLSYLIGSVSTGVIVARIVGLPDPRQTGSKNPGATNVLRLGNKKAAAITLAGDLLKGFIPVLLVGLIANAQTAYAAMSAAAIGAFVGHLLPIFFRFQGGKGVATAAGAMLALTPLIGLATIALWVFIAYTTRISSLAAIFSAIAASALATLFAAPELAFIISVIALILILRHFGNIQRLIKGEEPRIGESKPAEDQ